MFNELKISQKNGGKIVGSPPVSSKEGLLVLSFVSPEISPDKRVERNDIAAMNLSGRINTDAKSKKTLSRTEFEEKRTNSASRYEFVSVD
jgi:hypothetical protein